MLYDYSIMIKYLVVHCRHEGCYDYKYYEDNTAKLRFTSIRINPPKVFMFTNREQAGEFFEEYVSDIDATDPKCKRGEDIEHSEYCTCGIIETDDDENPILFYNKLNQIFLLENGPQVFVAPHELKSDINNMNVTNRLIRQSKKLDRIQRDQYVELGKICEDCNQKEDIAKQNRKNKTENNNMETNTMETNNSVDININNVEATANTMIGSQASTTMQNLNAIFNSTNENSNSNNNDLQNSNQVIFNSQIIDIGKKSVKKTTESKKSSEPKKTAEKKNTESKKSETKKKNSKKVDVDDNSSS